MLYGSSISRLYSTVYTVQLKKASLVLFVIIFASVPLILLTYILYVKIIPIPEKGGHYQLSLLYLKFCVFVTYFHIASHCITNRFITVVIESSVDDIVLVVLM